MSKKFTDLTQLTTPASNDVMPIDDVSAGSTKYITLSDLLKTPGVINFAALISTIFSGQVASYTNSGNGAGTGYYINLGGIKLCWGVSGAIVGIGATSTTSVLTHSLPTSFFTTVQYNSISIENVGTAPEQYVVGAGTSTSAVSFYLRNNSATTVSANISWFVIGT